MKSNLFITVFITMIFLQRTHAQLADSPWPILQHDLKHTGQSTNIGPKYPALAWKLNPGSGFNGSPSISNDSTIYIPGQDSCLYAISPQGVVKWKYKAEIPLQGTPTIGADGTIYIGSLMPWYDTHIAKLYAINQDGSLKWAIPLIGTEVLNCVIGSDGIIYVGANVSTTNSSIYRLFALYPNGAQKWSYDVTGPIGTPSIGIDGTIYVASGSGSVYPYTKTVYALNNDGSLRWKFDGPGFSGYLYGHSTFPVIMPNGSILIDDANSIIAINGNGNLSWYFNGGGTKITWMDSHPAVSNNGIIYFVMRKGQDSLFALNSDGTRKWSAYVGGYSTPPVIDSNSNIWVGIKDGKVIRFNASGELIWSGYLSGGYLSASEVSFMALGYSGILYFTSSDKNLYAYFNPDSSLTPDIQISKITFDPIDGVNIGSQTKIRAELVESSNKGSTRCNVMFYHTDTNPNHIIGSAYAFVPVGLKGYAEVVWNTQGLPIGEYTVIAVISNSNPPESNVSNNQLQVTYKLLKSIQNQMSAGSDTIWVEAGTYTENITMSGNKVVKSILGPQRTIINGNGAANVVQFNYLDSTAVLDGFTINGGGRGVSFERGGGIIRNCIIQKNQTGIWNIGSMVYTDPIIENNIITENTQYAMDTNNSFALLNKNTIVGNKTGVKGYGFYSSSPTIVNCILWNNNDDLVETASAIFSCIQNGDPGTGNISSDPLFVDSEHGDYHLQEGSPCINAGHPDPSFNDPDGSRADMGAFYYTSGTFVRSPKESLQPDKYQLAQNYPNPFNPVTAINYQLPKDSNVILRIFNINGQLVKTLIEEKQSAGYYKIQWDSRDENGNSVVGGLYLYQLKAEGFSQSYKMVLIR
jgi:hypothetical protein